MLFDTRKRNQRLVFEVTASHTRVAEDDNVLEVCWLSMRKSAFARGGTLMVRR